VEVQRHVAGTSLVKDINPGTASSPQSLCNVNGTLVFAATDAASGIELWRSDGTGLGTTQVKDINPGAGSSTPASITYANGTTFFSATDGAAGTELWKTDGTAGGTQLVKEIALGTASSSPDRFAALPGGSTLFVANGTELWRTDGTAAGTSKLQYEPVRDRANFHLAATLPDGNYRASLPAAAVSDPSGHALSSDASVDCFILAADASRDRVVDLTDFTILASNFNRSGCSSRRGISTMTRPAPST